MSIIDTSSLVQNEPSVAETGLRSPILKIPSPSKLRLPKVPHTIVASLRSKFEKLKVGFAVVTAAALPFTSGCSKSGNESYGEQGPNSPSAVSQSILPMTPDTKISLEQSVKIAQALASLSTDLKVVHKDIGALLKAMSSPTNSVDQQKTINQEKVAAQSRLERSTKIALLGTDQALKYVPTNQTFNALQKALKMAAQASKGRAASDATVLSESAKVVEDVGKGLSDIIERLGPAEHVVQLMDLRLRSQAVHKEISLMLSTLGSLPAGGVSSADYPKVQKAGHEAESVAKVFKNASTNTFFSTLSVDLQEVGSGLSNIASSTVTYVAYTNALGSAQKVISFKNESTKTLGKLSVVYDKIGEELSSLGSLGVIQMMTAPSGDVKSAQNAHAATTNVVTTYHTHPVFMHTLWRPWYGGYYYDGPSHYNSGLWSGFSSSRPVTSYSSSVHASTPSPSTGVSSVNGAGTANSASKAGAGGFGIVQHGFGSTTSAKSGFTSSAGSAGHGQSGTHVSSSAGKSSSVGRSGGFGGGAAGHGSGSSG
jgi:hypothetical protein